MPKKTILFIFHQNNFDGGASKSIISVLERLQKENIYNILVLLPKNGEIYNYLKKIGIKTIIVNYKWCMSRKNIKWNFKKIIFPLFNKLSFYKICRNLKGEKIDLIYTNTSVIENGFELSEKFKCKHIYHVREFGKEDHFLEYLYSLEERKRKLNSQNTQIITISHSLKKKYLKLTGRNDIKLIYNGVEECFLKKEYIKKEKINFLQVGTVVKGKNQLEALKAGKILIDKGISNFKINFVGSKDKEYINVLENYIKKNSLEKNIEFFGAKSSQEVKEMIREFDVGLMLSLKEAFGRVTVEYMLGGMPVVATNTGANPEIINNKKNGYLYKIGNPEELAEKFENFINDYSKIKKMGESARKESLKNYTAEINYRKIKKIIEKQVQK